MNTFTDWYESNDRVLNRVYTIEDFNRSNELYGPDWGYYNDPQTWLEEVNRNNKEYLKNK